MANYMQKFIYHLANIVPLVVVAALAWYVQYKTWNIPIVLLVVAVCITIVFALCFIYGKDNCSVKHIRVTSISSKDNWVVAYILAYILPFANLVISDFSIV